MSDKSKVDSVKRDGDTESQGAASTRRTERHFVIPAVLDPDLWPSSLLTLKLLISVVRLVKTSHHSDTLVLQHFLQECGLVTRERHNPASSDRLSTFQHQHQHKMTHRQNSTHHLCSFNNLHQNRTIVFQSQQIYFHTRKALWRGLVLFPSGAEPEVICATVWTTSWCSLSKNSWKNMQKLVASCELQQHQLFANCNSCGHFNRQLLIY